MKKITCLFAICLLFWAAQVAAGPLTDPANPHNLSSTSTNAVRATAETRICVFCHTPHGAVAQTALWNRDDPLGMGSFPLYTSVTLDIDDIAGAEYGTDYPNGASRMCLSCHDGISSIGAVINGVPAPLSKFAMTFDTLNDYGSGSIDLSSSHPISFVYDAAVLTALNAAELAGGGSGTEYRLSSNPKVKTQVGSDSKPRMQCTTCHDPHSDTRNASYDLPFWANDSGAGNDAVDYDGTCQACHQGSDWGGSWGGSLPLPQPTH